MTLPERPSWLTVALAGAGGFLVGVLLVAILGGPKGTVRTTTVTQTHVRTHTTTHTETVTKTVDSRVDVPDVGGQRLADARALLERQGFDVELANDPTLFGVQDERHFVVIGQDPAAGSTAQPGATVSLEIERG